MATGSWPLQYFTIRYDQDWGAWGSAVVWKTDRGSWMLPGAGSFAVHRGWREQIGLDDKESKPWPTLPVSHRWIITHTVCQAAAGMIFSANVQTSVTIILWLRSDCSVLRQTWPPLSARVVFPKVQGSCKDVLHFITLPCPYASPGVPCPAENVYVFSELLFAVVASACTGWRRHVRHSGKPVTSSLKLKCRLH